MLEFISLIFYILGTSIIGFNLFKEYSEEHNELFRILDEEFKKGWSFISTVISILFGIVLWFFLKPWGYFIGFVLGFLISYVSVNKLIPNLGKEAKPVDLLTYWASKYQFKRKILKPKKVESKDIKKDGDLKLEKIEIKETKKEEPIKKVMIEKPKVEEKQIKLQEEETKKETGWIEIKLPEIKAEEKTETKQEKIHGLWRKYQEKREHKPLWREKYEKMEEEREERRKIVEDLLKQLKSMKKEEKTFIKEERKEPKKEEK